MAAASGGAATLAGLAAAVAWAVAPGRPRHGHRLRRRVPLRSSAHGIEQFKIFKSADGEEFEILTSQVFGAGAQGTVYAGRVRKTGQKVAVKVIPTWRLILEDFGGREKLAAIEEEFATLRTLGSHPNIAGMIAGVDVFRENGAAAFPHYKFMVMEAVQGRELAEHVALGGPMRESVARHLFLQVLDGLAHMHSMGVIHRDLKPENVLVTGDTVTLDSRVKLIDFGVAKCVSDGPLKTVVGTPSIMAPEVAKAKIRYVPGGGGGASATGELETVGAGASALPLWAPPADRHSFAWGQPGPHGGGADPWRGSILHAKPWRFCPKIDVWSAGVVLYTCLTGKLPFKSEIEIIESDYHQELLGHCSEEAKNLLAGMLEKEPGQRLSVDECLLHSWIACSEDDACTMNWAAMERQAALKGDGGGPRAAPR